VLQAADSRPQRHELQRQIDATASGVVAGTVSAGLAQVGTLDQPAGHAGSVVRSEGVLDGLMSGGLLTFVRERSLELSRRPRCARGR